jgi:hypothetical protein
MLALCVLQHEDLGVPAHRTPLSMYTRGREYMRLTQQLKNAGVTSTQRRRVVGNMEQWEENV